MIIHIPFIHSLRLRSLLILPPQPTHPSRPRRIRLYTNLPQPPSFSDIEAMKPVQDLDVAQSPSSSAATGGPIAATGDGGGGRRDVEEWPLKVQKMASVWSVTLMIVSRPEFKVEFELESKAESQEESLTVIDGGSLLVRQQLTDALSSFLSFLPIVVLMLASLRRAIQKPATVLDSITSVSKASQEHRQNKRLKAVKWLRRMRRMLRSIGWRRKRGLGRRRFDERTGRRKMDCCTDDALVNGCIETHSTYSASVVGVEKRYLVVVQVQRSRSTYDQNGTPHPALKG